MRPIPCLLLLDEPAAGLRYLEKHALAELLRQLKGEGLSILLVEHDMDFVMGLVDRVVRDGLRRRRSPRACPSRCSAIPRVLEAYLGGVDEEVAA